MCGGNPLNHNAIEFVTVTPDAGELLLDCENRPVRNFLLTDPEDLNLLIDRALVGGSYRLIIEATDPAFTFTLGADNLLTPGNLNLIDVSWAGEDRRTLVFTSCNGKIIYWWEQQGQGDLSAFAPLASPNFTGTPTGPTAAPGTDSTQLATTAFVKAAIASIVDSSPAALDTLNELAAALGNDANFATTVTNSLAAKAPINNPGLTGTPTAPTAAPGTNTTQIASTAFVTAAVAAAGSPSTMLKVTAALSTTLSQVKDHAGTNSPLYLATNKGAINSAFSVGQSSNPTAQVDIKGSGATSGTMSLLIKNSSGSQTMKATDDGCVYFGSANQAKFSAAGQLSMDTWRSKTSFEDDKLEWLSDELTLTFANTQFASFKGSGVIFGGTSVAPTAIFQLDSTAKGFLAPRMTTAQRNAISFPANGLQVFDTDLNTICFYRTSDSSWRKVTDAAA